MAEVSDKQKEYAKGIRGSIEAAPVTDTLKAMWRRWTGDDSPASDVKPSPSPKPPAQKK